MSVFFFGMGYSARASARWIHQLIDADLPIMGTTRSRTKSDELRAAGVRAHAFDGVAPGMMLSADLMQATHVVLSIPPGPGGDPALTHHRGDLNASKSLQWLCYFSTVGVYGDAGGAWIDESAECHPGSGRSERRLAAEQAWCDYARQRGVPLLVLRLAGIYGPGRSSLDKLREGSARRIVKPGQVFNRIHVDDIGRITAMAAARNLAGTYNVTDDEPAPPQDLTTFGAELLGAEPPEPVRFRDAELSGMARSFYLDNKRCSNAGIKKALGIDLLYPSYREGLTAIHESGEALPSPPSEEQEA
jgi:nucleoside-diphosphate-sugar epimerase